MFQGRVIPQGLSLWRSTGGPERDSPSNSAWPTPMMMMDIGSLAACETAEGGGCLGPS